MPPERYKTEGTVKVSKLHLQFFKTFEWLTIQVIYYFTLLRVHSAPLMDFVHSREQILGTGSPSILSGVRPDRHWVTLISRQATI
jgi:hypothetical protein